MKKKIEDTSIDLPVWIGFGIAFFVMVMVAGISLSNVVQSSASAELLDHTHKVMSKFYDLRIQAARAENKQWNYMLTNNHYALEERDTSIKYVRDIFPPLLDLAKDNPAQQARIARLQSAFENRFTVLIDGQLKFDADGHKIDRVFFDAGQVASNAIRTIITQAEQEEQGLLLVRKEREMSRVKTLAIITVLLLAFLLLLSAWIQKAVRHRLAVKQEWFDQQLPLLKNGALQDAIFKCANFSCIATDVQGVIQIFNVGAERMLGYGAAEVIGKVTPADISDPQEIIALLAALSVELDTSIAPGFGALVMKASLGIEDIYELTYFRKDGSRFPAIVSVTALRDAEDVIIGYLWIGSDNTARKQVEAEREINNQHLRDLQFYTRTLIEANTDAMMTTDTLGIISDINHEMELLTGRSREELIGTPSKNYFTNPERAETAINTVLREGKISNFELTVTSKDDKLIVVSYNATTFRDSNDKLVGVFASARDITHRKEFERLMEKNNIELMNAMEQADKANLAKSEFLSSMSHELRTPLNAVLGFAQLIASDVPAPTATQQMAIDQILQAGWYLLRLINEILDLTMIESGKVTLSLEPISFANVLQDCEAMIAPQAQKHGIKMIFPSVDSSFCVHADRTRVKQVVINLLSNAIKYNSEGGTVTVTCVNSGEHHVRVSVTDTGNGLTPKQLTQLFEPFNRLGQESSSKEGTGIGLVVTKQLIELMDGTIGVQSSVGVGSVFWIELPGASLPILNLCTEQTEDVTHSVPALAAREKNKRSVLYVEDNIANMNLVAQLLARRNDLVLLSAVDGQAGIQMARTYVPQVILMDISLPGIDGFSALKILREDPRTAHIPVLALSANAMPLDIEKGLEAGFLRYLTKPINVSEFMETLDLALEYAEVSNDIG